MKRKEGAIARLSNSRLSDTQFGVANVIIHHEDFKSGEQDESLSLLWLESTTCKGVEVFCIGVEVSVNKQTELAVRIPSIAEDFFPKRLKTQIATIGRKYSQPHILSERSKR